MTVSACFVYVAEVGVRRGRVGRWPACKRTSSTPRSTTGGSVGVNKQTRSLVLCELEPGQFEARHASHALPLSLQYHHTQWNQSCKSPAISSTLPRSSSQTSSKALKVVDLKDILTKSATTVPAKANKQELISRILASPAALAEYNNQHSPAPVEQNEDLVRHAPLHPESHFLIPPLHQLAPPEEYVCPTASKPELYKYRGYAELTGTMN